MSAAPAFDAVLRHDRRITMGALGLAIVLAWSYLLAMPMSDNGMARMAITPPPGRGR